MMDGFGAEKRPPRGESIRVYRWWFQIFFIFIPMILRLEDCLRAIGKPHFALVTIRVTISGREPLLLVLNLLGIVEEGQGDRRPGH